MYPPATRSVRLTSPDDLALAREAVSRALVPTPLVNASADGTPAWLKLESLQPTGSFKVRGAITAISALNPGQRVLAVSAGNHALGMAWASQRTGIPATVVIAETASAAKRSKLQQLPIELILHGDSYEAAEAFAVERARHQDADTVFISAYNDPLVIAGQSTIVDELIVQAPPDQPLTILVPTGGGGMLAGIALRAADYRQMGHDVSVIGVETEASTAVSASIEAGRVTDVTVSDSVADGLTGNLEPGSITPAVASGRVARMVRVSEVQIRQAMRHLIISHGIIAEGAGAATTAAVLAGHTSEVTGTVVAIVSGRNVTPAIIQQVLAE